MEYHVHEKSRDNFCTRTLATTLKWSTMRVGMEKKKKN